MQGICVVVFVTGAYDPAVSQFGPEPDPVYGKRFSFQPTPAADGKRSVGYARTRRVPAGTFLPTRMERARFLGNEALKRLCLAQLFFRPGSQAWRGSYHRPYVIRSQDVASFCRILEVRSRPIVTCAGSSLAGGS